jgi:hypothetical protein
MKKIFLVILILTALYACSKEEPSDNNDVIWKPNLVSVIGDGNVQLYWTVIFDDMLRPYEILDPDKFDILISEDNKNFRKIIELHNNKTYTYKIDNLQNGQPYFFYVVSKKEGYKSLSSMTIMVIPNKKIEVENIFRNEGMHTLWDATVSLSKNKIAYTDAYYTWDDKYMAEAIFISNMDGSDKELIEINSSAPSWSPDGEKIIFHTCKGEINTGNGMPSQIAMYDCNIKTITKLTNGTDYNYHPVFSENGEFILFGSNKNLPNYAFNIWLMKLNTLEMVQITDKTILEVPHLNWVDNDDFLFHAYFDEIDTKKQIYKSSVTDKKISKIFSSDWNDYSPSASPDGKKTAFMSDRSGTGQIWIYNSDNKKYIQITGFSDEEYVSTTHINWLDNFTIAYTINDNIFVKQKIEY